MCSRHSKPHPIYLMRPKNLRAKRSYHTFYGTHSISTSSIATNTVHPQPAIAGQNGIYPPPETPLAQVPTPPSLCKLPPLPPRQAPVAQERLLISREYPTSHRYHATACASQPTVFEPLRWRHVALAALALARREGSAPVQAVVFQVLRWILPRQSELERTTDNGHTTRRERPPPQRH